MTAISRLVLPEGLTPTTVPSIAVSAPVAAIEKPETVADPAFDVYTNRPLGVATCQHVAAAKVGTPRLDGSEFAIRCHRVGRDRRSVRLPCGAGFRHKAAPLGANVMANTPGSALGLTTIDARTAIELDVERVDAIGELFGDEKELAVRAK